MLPRVMLFQKLERVEGKYIDDFPPVLGAAARTSFVRLKWRLVGNEINLKLVSVSLNLDRIMAQVAVDWRSFECCPLLAFENSRRTLNCFGLPSSEAASLGRIAGKRQSK